MLKRLFDIVFAIVGFVFLGFIIIFFWILTSIDTKSNGFFIQERIGQWGNKFRIVKLKTMYPITGRISTLGSFLRKTKIDELPQLWNVLIGEMSIVGPRPDISGYYDLLEGESRRVLELKPGLTSTASLKYYNEDMLLSLQENPLTYNDEVLFPDKVKLNLEYYYNQSFKGDLIIIWKTIFR